jgi:hypothetical protein
VANEPDGGDRIQARRKAIAQGLPDTFEHAADALERSAELAEDHAAWADMKGRAGSGEIERKLAKRARDAARRSREAAARMRANPPI